MRVLIVFQGAQAWAELTALIWDQTAISKTLNTYLFYLACINMHPMNTEHALTNRVYYVVSKNGAEAKEPSVHYIPNSADATPTGHKWQCSSFSPEIHRQLLFIGDMNLLIGGERMLTAIPSFAISRVGRSNICKKNGPSPMKGRSFSWTWFFLWANGQPYFEFHREKDVPAIFRVMPSTLSFLRSITALGALFISHSFGGLCRVHGRIQHRTPLFLETFDRYELHLASCEIWNRVALTRKSHAQEKGHPVMGDGSFIFVWRRLKKDTLYVSPTRWNFPSSFLPPFLHLQRLFF